VSRKRNIRYQLWLGEKEADVFNKHVKRSVCPVILKKPYWAAVCIEPV
jgi:hypothetical protein